MNGTIINSKARTGLEQLRHRRARCLEEMNLIEQLIPLHEKLVAIEEPDIGTVVEYQVIPRTPNESQSFVLLNAEYPKHGSKQEKIKHILLKANRAMRLPEIQSSIEIIEGPDESKKTILSLNYIVKQLASDGDILVGKKSNRYTFYALPSFVEEGRIKPEHFPSTESWGSLPEKSRDASKLKWKGAKS